MQVPSKALSSLLIILLKYPLIAGIQMGTIIFVAIYPQLSNVTTFRHGPE